MRFILLLSILISSNVAVGQLTGVDRNTGRIIPCDELGCDNDDSTFENTDRICLNCLMRLSDSTLQAEKNRILRNCNTQKKGCNSFIKEQKSWELKCEKKATKESDELIGV